MIMNARPQGFTLLIIMIAICIIALLFYGSGFFTDSGKSHTEQTIDNYQSAKEDISEIEKINNQRVQTMDAEN